MPPKDPGKKNHAGGSKESDGTAAPPGGSETRTQTDANQNRSMPVPPTDEGEKATHGTGPAAEAHRAAAASSTGGDTVDVVMEDASVKDKDESARIAALEAQLRSAQSSNVNLQRTVADYEKQLASGSAGPRKSLDERARAIGFTHDSSGRLILGPPPGQGFDSSKPYVYTGSKEIGGSLTDYEMGCGDHRRVTLQVMPVAQPPTAVFWSASTPLELARGAAVAEAVNMSTTQKEQFYMGTSPAVLELRLAEPTDEQIVMAMLKMLEECKERKQAFLDAMRAPFKCTTTADAQKAARKILIAERVRAALEGGKSLQTDESIVVGGRNATRFAASLGTTAKSAPTLAELRTFLSSHFASSVKRVFIWLDLPDDNVVADVFVSQFAEALKAAAAWEHVVFVVLPPPYTELRLQSFEVFMDQFNKASPQLKNVLWLDDRVRWDGYRFTRALGANELALDQSSVYPEGTVSSKGAGAAVKFLNKYCSWLIIEQHDPGDQRPNTSNEASLHVVRGGKVGKNPARGAPSRGGGGTGPQRGRGNYQGRGRGNQQNSGKRHRGFDFL